MQIAFDIALVVLLLAIAGWTIVAREAFSAVVVFMVFGLLLSLAWVRLAAVDVALTEAAIGSGVTGMLLLNAAAILRPVEASYARPSVSLRIIAGVFAAAVAGTLGGLVIMFKGEPVSLAPLVLDHLPASGLDNPVAGVLFVFRSLDTLLEKVVLVLALIGVWSLAPDKFWGGAPGLRVFGERQSILVFLAQTLPPIGIIVAVYMTWVGASEPGGAFQGGAILAAMWILVMVAGLRNVPPISSQTMRLAMMVGPLCFLVIGLAGIVLAGSFLAYPAGLAKPLIVVIEITLALSIGITLGLLAAGAPAKAPAS